MSFKECINKGLIRKHNTKDRVPKSIEISKKFLKSAKNNINIKEFEMVVLASYNSIFHSCRTLLFNKNYIEKSHYCLSEALKELYKNDCKILNFLNSIDKVRLSRHEIQYRGEFANIEEADYVFNLAKEFLEYVEKLIT